MRDVDRLLARSRRYSERNIGVIVILLALAGLLVKVGSLRP